MSRRTGWSRWVSRRALVTLLAVLAATALAGVAGARVRRPISLRIEGAFDQAPEGVRPLQTIEVRIGKEKTRRLAVTKILNQGAGPLGATILDEAARYKPAFRLLGDRAQLEKLLAAPAGHRLAITGHLTSDRHVLVSLVEVAG